uniref:Uncharacterized protein n=1 Tax=Ditylenchus dipsaci TaxID=166011 RepID=A0A915DYK6_9BILA
MYTIPSFDCTRKKYHFSQASYYSSFWEGLALRPSSDERLLGIKLFRCDSSCRVCYKLNNPLKSSSSHQRMTGEFKEVPSMLLVNSSTNKVSCGMNFRVLKSSYLGQQSYKNLKSYVSPNHAWSAVSASSSNELLMEWSNGYRTFALVADGDYMEGRLFSVITTSAERFFALGSEILPSELGAKILKPGAGAKISTCPALNRVNYYT